MNKSLMMTTMAGAALAVFLTAPASAQSPMRLLGEAPEVQFRNLADFAVEDAQAESATDIQLVSRYGSFRPRSYGYRAYRTVPYSRYRVYGPTYRYGPAYRAYGPTFRYVPPYPYYGRPVYPSYGLYFRF